MSRRLGRQEGFALVELLIASVLMVAVMGTAFAALSQFEQTSNRNVKQNDAQDAARSSVDIVVKRLRNDAAPTPGDPQGIDRATDKDLVFQSVDPQAAPAGSENAHNVMRVRYCLDTSAPQNEKLWVQYQRWQSAAAPGMPSSAVCPDAAWGNQALLADHIVNYYGGASRPVWTIDCPSGFDSATCSQGTDPAMLARIKRVGMELFVDRDTATQPPESRLAAAVYFRNQNARPSAAIANVNSQAGHVYPNASTSSDPDAERLFYRWCYFGTNAPSSAWCANGTPIPQQTVAIDYAPNPAPPVGTTVTIGLRVQDPGGLVSYDYKQVTLR